MTDWSKFDEALSRQKTFSDLYFTDDIDEDERTERLKSFVLSLHAEVTGICEAVDYKDHHRTNAPADLPKVLFKSVDAYRYLLAILNLWGFSAEEFTRALSQKDDCLHFQRELRHRSPWSPGQPVALFDVDDVLADFRDKFCKFASDRIGVFVDPMSEEYYATSTFKKVGVSNDEVFDAFVNGHGFDSLDVIEKYADLMRALSKAGCRIQVITARPAKNLIAYHDTYSWLARSRLPVDDVVFTPEKYVWLAGRPYYGKTKIIAVDDSAKHSAEYAKHGVPVIVPAKTYNREAADIAGVHYVEDDEDPTGLALRILGCNV